MSNLVDEINACGITCITVYDGEVITDPPYSELSSGEKAIVNACIAAHNKPYEDATVVALAALLTTNQKLAYKRVRNKPIWIERFQQSQDGTPEFYQQLWIMDLKTKAQVQAEIQGVWDSLPLWKDED